MPKRRPKRPQKGSNAWDSLKSNLAAKARAQRGSGIFDTIKSAAKKGYDYAKKTKIISKGAKAIGDITGSETAYKVGRTAKKYGFGNLPPGGGHHEATGAGQPLIMRFN